MTKEEIITALAQAQSNVVNDLRKAINVYESASDIDEDDTIDPEDFSHQTEAKDMQLRLEEKLKREENTLVVLNKFKNKPIQNIETGALVETDKYYFYIGVATHPLEINNKKVVGISQKAPIMAVLKGKKIGEEISVGNVNYIILNIS